MGQRLEEIVPGEVEVEEGHCHERGLHLREPIERSVPSGPAPSIVAASLISGGIVRKYRRDRRALRTLAKKGGARSMAAMFRPSRS
jgi:hypothetical protein